MCLLDTGLRHSPLAPPLYQLLAPGGNIYRNCSTSFLFTPPLLHLFQPHHQSNSTRLLSSVLLDQIVLLLHDSPAQIAH